MKAHFHLNQETHLHNEHWTLQKFLFTAFFLDKMLSLSIELLHAHSSLECKFCKKYKTDKTKMFAFGLFFGNCFHFNLEMLTCKMKTKCCHFCSLQFLVHNGIFNVNWICSAVLMFSFQSFEHGHHGHWFHFIQSNFFFVWAVLADCGKLIKSFKMANLRKNFWNAFSSQDGSNCDLFVSLSGWLHHIREVYICGWHHSSDQSPSFSGGAVLVLVVR